jgi:hypothetical protein
MREGVDMVATAGEIGVLGLTFDRKVDAGAFLTFVTLVVGFLGWTYKTVKEWRRDARREAESGALRLLLKILRERYQRDAGPISLSDLRAEFDRPERKVERKAYCERDFRFKNDPQFERAIYSLRWEFKIDFAGADDVLFRTQKPDETPAGLELPVNHDVAITAFRTALEDREVSSWDTERLGRLAARADLGSTRDALLSAMDRAKDDPQRTRELLVLSEALRR